MKLLLRFFGFLFAAGTILFVVGVAATAGLLWHYSKDLPDYSQLQDYEPPVMTRVHAADGSLVAEYARERRLYIPIQAVPKLVINAFLAAEDKNFYEHGGLDFFGITRAAVNYAQNFGSSRRPQGASTITQQVAKNFLLSNEVSFTRKIKEMCIRDRPETERQCARAARDFGNNPASGNISCRYSAIASVSQILMPSWVRHGTRNEGDSRSSSARVEGSSLATACSAKSSPAILHNSQPRSDQEP